MGLSPSMVWYQAFTVTKAVAQLALQRGQCYWALCHHDYSTQKPVAQALGEPKIGPADICLGSIMCTWALSVSSHWILYDGHCCKTQKSSHCVLIPTDSDYCFLQMSLALMFQFVLSDL